jgi:hypothetical protein
LKPHSKGDATSLQVISVLTRSKTACTRLVSRKGEPHSRPRKCALPHEDIARRSH